MLTVGSVGGASFTAEKRRIEKSQGLKPQQRSTATAIRAVIERQRGSSTTSVRKRRNASALPNAIAARPASAGRARGGWSLLLLDASFSDPRRGHGLPRIGVCTASVRGAGVPGRGSEHPQRVGRDLDHHRGALRVAVLATRVRDRDLHRGAVRQADDHLSARADVDRPVDDPGQAVRLAGVAVMLEQAQPFGPGDDLDRPARRRSRRTSRGG